jgi:hypothetical protein
MPRDVSIRRYSGESPVGLWPRSFESGSSIMSPSHPWVASVGGEQRVFRTFREAVDYLYFQCRTTSFREPPTEELSHLDGPD